MRCEVQPRGGEQLQPTGEGESQRTESGDVAQQKATGEADADTPQWKQTIGWKEGQRKGRGAGGCSESGWGENRTLTALPSLTRAATTVASRHEEAQLCGSSSAASWDTLHRQATRRADAMTTNQSAADDGVRCKRRGAVSTRFGGRKSPACRSIVHPGMHPLFAKLSYAARHSTTRDRASDCQKKRTAAM